MRGGQHDEEAEQVWKIRKTSAPHGPTRFTGSMPPRREEDPRGCWDDPHAGYAGVDVRRIPAFAGTKT